jgi:hypothetical protein
MAEVREPEAREKSRLSAPVGFRLRPEERQKVEELAEALDVSLSDAGRIIFRRGLDVGPQVKV